MKPVLCIEKMMGALFDVVCFKVSYTNLGVLKHSYQSEKNVENPGTDPIGQAEAEQPEPDLTNPPKSDPKKMEVEPAKKMWFDDRDWPSGNLT